MKKLLFILLLSTGIFSCRKQLNELPPQPEIPEFQSHTIPTENGFRKIGVEGFNPDLWIPQRIFTVDGYPNGYGLWMTGAFALNYGPLSEFYAISYQQPLNTPRWFFRYSCTIGNAAPQDPTGNGSTDFVVDRSEDGIPTAGGLYGGYSFPGLTETTVFKNVNGFAEQTEELQKQLFNVTYTDYNRWIDWNLVRFYKGDTMAIQSECFDEYTNVAPLPGDAVAPTPGEYVLSVQVDPDSLTHDTNRENNVSVLPFEVLPGGVVGTVAPDPILKPDILNRIRTKPVTNLTGQYIKGLRGAKSKIRLDWDCPYHTPYVRHKFKIVYTTNIDPTPQTIEFQGDSVYDFEVKGNFQSGTYHVYIYLPGIGYSDFQQISVSKR